ncbi:MAG TPA: YkvA family protein [Egibacteraceae bacterium]|nr:YkvA family protein [Egibacteraceae bacterium]
MTVAVPGPPRGRRRQSLGDAVRRVQAMREAETAGTPGASLLRLVADVVLLLKDLAADPRVPRGDKLVAALAAGYLVVPVDLIPDWLPVVGQVDDLVVLAMAVRRLLGAAGYDVIYELWRGTDEGLALVLTLAGIEE